MLLTFYATKNACEMSQNEFIKKLHVSLPNDLKGQCRTTEAPDFLFKVDPEAELVEPKKQE